MDVADQFGHAVARVTAPRYHEVVAFARDDADLACDYCDFVTVVDRQEEGFEVVTHLASTTRRHSVRLKVLLPREAPAVATISDLYPTADWHERECMEMFGIDVVGHPEPVKLLLPEPFEGHPLRKDFALMSRVAKPWPGAAEGEGEEDEEE
ncbi:MAG: NADH-quinone oxidoreductase subunit C [Actinomycetota bacterium]